MWGKGSLKGKKFLVTGASSGIGFQVAESLLNQGAIVGVHYRSNLAGANLLLDRVTLDRSKLFQADFSNSNDVLRLWTDFITWSKGGIDGLINNAGESVSPATLYDLSEEGWDDTFNVNVKAPFLLSRAALSVMCKQESGSIVNVSSIGVKFGGGSNTIHYSASKAALEAITRSFAKAGAPYNVRVNAIRAGVTDTPLHNKIDKKRILDRTSLIPLGRMATPNEIAAAILFLLGDQSSYITGTVIPVSGGE